ncbi:copper homeostasis protein CutC [Branchiibius sp. NY16-3462-2]|uniref:copper homeostasis protein CutC n=1 Tax=Branchiibius sp. NY16-3462-2 TaxID=1807500 RepID=UPI0007957C66|nr:copper homeostasis protein CutC [Branchiibius sp. NY16-3462-2]KYH43163.1 hypothetical protein AZH51_12430 [Branchiibius sp. NY16-3462-2]
MTVPAFELIAQDPHGFEVATAVGADRIELCCALELGGLTPSAALIDAAVAARETGGPEVHVLVRSRPGGFEYSPAELDLMVADAVTAVQRGADGVVVGASQSGVLDLTFIDRVVSSVGDACVTVHRVVDSLADPVGAVNALRDKGVRRVLTSGGADKAPDGVATIAAMVQATEGQIEIMAGGGVTVASVPALIETGVSAVHASASGRTQPDLDIAQQFAAAIKQTR